MIKIPCSLLFLLFSTQLYACKEKDKSTDNNVSKMDSINVKITIGEKTATAVLYDNPASRDFASQFPLTLELEDYNRTEKISVLAKKLSSDGAPRGFDPAVGDITYYEPWGNIALFYKNFGYANGLISLGKITSGLDIFTAGGTVIAKFELAN